MKENLKPFFIKLAAISIAIIIIINLLFNVLLGERLEKIDWQTYHSSLPFNESALALYEWSPIAEELKTLDRKIVLNSMILKWDNIKKEFISLINF